MRSCEYSKVNTAASARKTKKLRIRNIRFFRNGRIIAQTDPTLPASDYVSITFEDQKNGDKMDTITQQASGDLILCPVRAWASIVRRILTYPTTTPDSHVNTVYTGGEVSEIKATEISTAIKAAVTAIGFEKLGFKASEAGTHSIRSGAAMAMYLDEVPVYTMMLLGRWSSDAFLRYIRKQVEQFSRNVSSHMIRNQHFTHVPQRENRVSRHDPRQRNHAANLQTRQNMAGAGPEVLARMTRLTLWH